MSHLPKNIVEFLGSNKLATVCFVDNQGNPYCINCFYYFDEEHQSLVFKSSNKATHHSFIQNGSGIAGTILPNSLDFLKIKGAQFRGNLIDDQQIKEFEFDSKYSKRHPMSMAISGYIWAVKLNFVKFMDSTFGFGKDTVWENVDLKQK